MVVIWGMEEGGIHRVVIDTGSVYQLPTSPRYLVVLAPIIISPPPVYFLHFTHILT